MTGSTVKTSGRVGRPRDPNLDRAILDVATRQLGAAGYANLSLESVAREAGTTVPSLRRRHPTKLDLVLAVIDALRVEPVPTADRDPRLRAQAILRDFNRALLRDNAMTVVGSLLAEQHRNPALLERFQTRIVESRRSAIHDALADGIRRGSLPTGTDLDVATNMLIGSFYARYLTSRGLPANWADRVLDAFWPTRTLSA
jgi:AcrR family transcriptional regulator